MGKDTRYMTILQAVITLGIVLISGIFFSRIIPYILPVDVAIQQLVVYIIMMANAIIYIRTIKSRAFNYSSVSKLNIHIRWIKFYYVLLAIVLLQFCSIAFAPYINALDSKHLESYYNSFFTGNLYISFLSSVLLAPILEEILFRGYIQRGLEYKYGAFNAIIISSVIFAMVHLSVVQSLPALVCSLIFGIIYVMSKYSLSTVICIHFLNNLFAFTQMYFMKGVRFDLKEILNSQELYNIIYFGAIILLAIFLIFGLLFIKYRGGDKEQIICNK